MERRHQAWSYAPTCGTSCVHLHCMTTTTPVRCNAAVVVDCSTVPRLSQATPLLVCRNAAHGREQRYALQVWHADEPHLFVCSNSGGGVTLQRDMDDEGTAFTMDLDDSDCSASITDRAGNRLDATASFTRADAERGATRWRAHPDHRPGQAGALLLCNVLTDEFLVLRPRQPQ